MLISLTGPSGVGKGFVKNFLTKHIDGLRDVCWTTTRPLRTGEAQGLSRESVYPKAFHALKDSGELVFVQELFGHHYGLRRDFLSQHSGNFITELHIDNLILAGDTLPCTMKIALLPVNTGFLEARLLRRGTESAKEMAQRLEAAKQEVLKIERWKDLFSLVMYVSQENEDTVCEDLRTFVTNELRQI